MTWLYAALALLCGLGLSIQVGFNNGLRAQMGHPIPAALTSFATGTLFLVVYTLATRPAWPGSPHLAKGPWWMWLGGVVGACYIATTAAFATKLGAARWLALVVAGQILTSVLLDHFGLIGFPTRAISAGRVVGVILLITGVVIVLRT